MAERRPFATLPVAALPDEPRRPHPFCALPVHRVRVASPHFGEHTIVYRKLGSGPPLLLVHGLMTSGYSFRYVIEPLARFYTVYAPDLVGQGDSDKPDASYDARSPARSASSSTRSTSGAATSSATRSAATSPCGSRSRTRRRSAAS